MLIQLKTNKNKFEFYTDLSQKYNKIKPEIICDSEKSIEYINSMFLRFLHHSPRYYMYKNTMQLIVKIKPSKFY